MKSTLFVMLFAVAAGSVACSSSTTRWAKGGSTPEDLRLDQDACASRSQGYDFVFDDRDSTRTGELERGADSGARRAGSAPGDVYRDCMETRGWRRERGSQTSR